MNLMVTPARPELVYAAIPALFVLLWSSGFIAAKIGVAHADTLTFLGLRYAVVTVLMSALVLAMGARGRGIGARSRTSRWRARCYRRSILAAFGWRWVKVLVRAWLR